MRFYNPLAYLTVFAASVVALDFSNSSWIWTDELTDDGVSPVSTRPFRREFFTPSNKFALYADVLIVVDDAYTLWANGQQVGSGDNWVTAQGFCTLLNPFWNVFAVSGNNTGGQAGFIATIQIGYTDGSTDTVNTDADWKTLSGQDPPTGFEQPDFRATEWVAAKVHQVGGWSGISLPTPRQTTPPGLSASTWIWTNEVSNGVAPVGARAFRRTINLPNGATTGSARIIIAADDNYKLFVQGTLRDQRDTAYTEARSLVANFCPSNQVTIAVQATNTDGPAGLLMAIQFNSTDCVCSSAGCPVVLTDDGWRYSLTADPSDDAAMYKPGFDDSAWPSAVVEGPFGMAPWGNIPIVPPV